MSFVNLTVFIINFVKKSLQIELNDFADLLDVRSVTKQAFSKARKKLSSMVFKLLNQKLLDEFYTDNEIRTYKGFRILAVDGSTLRLPDHPELFETFGKSSPHSRVPVARISILYDVLNRITLNGTIKAFKISEHCLLSDHIDYLISENKALGKIVDLLLFDRGYPSAALLCLLNHLKKHFIIRITDSFLPEVNAAIKAGKRDTIVTVPKFEQRLTTSRFRNYFPNLSRNTTIQVRVLVFDLPNDNKEYLITSLLDQSLYSSEDIFSLYGLRWNVEEGYKFIKHIAQAENFSGKTKIAVEQDFFASIFACNIASMLMMEAQDELEKEYTEKPRKYEYKINRNVLIGTLKNDILDILMSDQNLEEYCTKIKNRIKKHLVPIRPGRSYDRLARDFRLKVLKRAV